MKEKLKTYLVKWLKVGREESFKCKFSKIPIKGEWIQTSEFTWYFQEEGKSLDEKDQYFTI